MRQLSSRTSVFRTLGALLLSSALAAVAAPASTPPGGLGNDVLRASWRVDDGHLADLVVRDLRRDRAIPITVPFAVTLEDGRRLDTSAFTLQGEVRRITVPGEAKSSRLAGRTPVQGIEARFLGGDGTLQLDWRLLQAADTNYLREVVTFTAIDRDVPITRIELLGAKAEGAIVGGDVAGSPIVAGDLWFGIEHPMAEADAWRGMGKSSIARTLPLRAGHSATYSAVVGSARDGQLRRDFAEYLERERAHPYRPFLHYNSWYDIGYFTPYTEREALERIERWGRELVRKRHVAMDSFLFDDGWDDYGGDWRFSKDFPRGFARLREAAKKYGAAPGVWLSPWGGYGKPKAQRVENARKLGYEIVDGGLALSGPKYGERFHAVTMELLDKYGINQFKFDGTGNVDAVYPGSAHDSDFAAAIQLIDDIRRRRPDTFINLTTGTWASPFWLRWADSIWRDGYDHNFTGKGTPRQRWITYRDRETYDNIVVNGPLFPLDSLMLHGIIYATHAVGLDSDPGHDFADEVYSYFASGTQLQELYITPSLLDDADWDTLATAARWSRDNAAVLRDTHWIGGNPGRLDVYGWAAWTPARAFITLRNPDDRPRMAILDAQGQLELPADAARRFAVRKLHGTGDGVPQRLDAARAIPVTLRPFEVLMLELTPAAQGKP